MSQPRETCEDEIVREVRAARDALAKKFNYDIDAIFKHLRVMEEEGRKTGRMYVDCCPQLPGAKVEP
jgi:hypothetical protein